MPKINKGEWQMNIPIYIQNYLLFLPRVQTLGCAQCSGHWGFCCWWPLLCQQGSLGEELWAQPAQPSCVSEHTTHVASFITGHTTLKYTSDKKTAATIIFLSLIECHGHLPNILQNNYYKFEYCCCYLFYFWLSKV